jgi:hypothetical protein
MSKTKINIAKTITGLARDAERLAANVGVMALAATTVVGMTELANHQDIKVVANQRPAFAAENSTVSRGPDDDISMRKERDEVAHQSVSYGTTMRSHAVAGKR